MIRINTSLPIMLAEFVLASPSCRLRHASLTRNLRYWPHSTIATERPSTNRYQSQIPQPSSGPLRKTAETEAEYGKIRRWLNADDALFWVAGKPELAKSTFMKSIAGSNETNKCLAARAGKRDLLVISRYFAIHGTPIQRSLGGLLLSLVFDILVQEPMLIPKLLVDRWERSGEQPQ